MRTVPAFTLLETLVAVAILLMALLGPFSIAQQALRSAYYARDQVTAYYLAQEGVEFVRAVRDENYLAGADWMSGIGGVCTGAVCTVDYPNFTYTACPPGGCPPLKVSSNGGLYNHTSGTDSPFTRHVLLTQSPTNPDLMIVSVTISWKSSGVSRVFTIQERLFNWL